MVYTDPLIHLIIDFVTEYTIAESQTFAILHKMESQSKTVQSAMNKLKDHGILNMIEMKFDKFKSEYRSKLGLTEEEMSKKSLQKVQVYYFNVDLKFILKARITLLSQAFEEKIKLTEKNGDTYRCEKKCSEKEYSQIEAVAEQFTCSKCQKKLVEIQEKNKLNEDD